MIWQYWLGVLGEYLSVTSQLTVGSRIDRTEKRLGTRLERYSNNNNSNNVIVIVIVIVIIIAITKTIIIIIIIILFCIVKNSPFPSPSWVECP